MRTTDRETTLLEHEQELRKVESAADIETRRFGQWTGIGIAGVLLGLALLALFFAPLEGVERVWAVAVILSPLAIFGLAIIVRGRYSDNERDVARETLSRLSPGEREKPKEKVASPSDRALPFPGDPELPG